MGLGKKRLRDQKHKHRLEQLLVVGRWYPPPVIEVECYKGKRLKRLSRGGRDSNRYKFYKRYANRVVRYSRKAYKGSGYRRVFDYWWAVD